VSPRILAFAWVLGACTVPPIPTPPPLPPLPPRPAAAEADPPPVAVAAPTPADEVPPEPVAAAPAPRVHPPETVALFVANCAQCHGEKGDGEGVTQLDRKARSFLDGGFSYGNTPDAIFRSITHGIPGTPMPGFEKPLNEAQRRELASYVIALGPADQIVVDAKDSEMVVTDMPLIVRGKLPAIVEGAPEWPRGLAIGTPEGLTFTYRADDVQLIGVLAGRFVNRKDWGGRGGDALEPLGRVLDVRPVQPLSDIDTVQAVFSVGKLSVSVADLACELRATSARKDGATLEYDLIRRTSGGEPEVLATVVEAPSAYQGRKCSGFQRTLRITARAPVADLWVQPSRGRLHGPSTKTASSVLVWCREPWFDPVDPQSFDDTKSTGPLVVVRAPQPVVTAIRTGPFMGLSLDLDANESVNVDVIFVPQPDAGATEEAWIIEEFGQP